MNLNKKQKRIIIYSLLINYVIYMLMQLFFYPVYESQLDVMMRAAISGVSGTRTAYILFSNVLIGGLLKGLTAALPLVNWYSMCMCVCIFGALSLICYVIIKRTDNKIGLTVCAVFVSFAGYECYILPGYMKTASVVGIAMLVVLADYMETKVKRSRKREFLIGFLAVLSSLICFSVFLVTVGIGLTGFGIYFAVKNPKKVRALMKKEIPVNWLYIKRITVVGTCIVFVVLLLHIVDNVSYYISGQESAAEYRGTLVRMYGYGMRDYSDSCQETYGIDAAEYAAMKSGNFGVTDEASWDTLRKLSKEGPGKLGQALNSYFKTVPVGLFKYGIFYLYIIMMYLLLFSPLKQKKFLIWAEIGMLLVSFFAAYLENAWKNNWMVFVLILPLLVPLLLAVKGAEEKECSYLWAYLAVLTVILYSKFSSGMVSSVSEEKMAERFETVDTQSINLVDLNAYLKTFSASHVYVADILKNENIKVSNGAYALMEGFGGKTLEAYPSEDTSYKWIYNPGNVSVWDLIFRD